MEITHHIVYHGPIGGAKLLRPYERHSTGAFGYVLRFMRVGRSGKETD